MIKRLTAAAVITATSIIIFANSASATWTWGCGGC